MKTLEIEFPDKLAEQIETFIKSGWFHSEDELVRRAVEEFVRRNRLDLVEQFQMEDIESARERIRELKRNK